MKSENHLNNSNRKYRLENCEEIDTDTSPPLSPKKKLPIPKGDSAYSRAKIAEYEEKDLPKAESLYRQAILKNDHKTSAIKDLASLIHQLSRTQEAIDLLKSHEQLFKFDRKAFENLCSTLSNQLSKKDEKKLFIKISKLSINSSKNDVSKLFKSDLRIKDYRFDKEINDGEPNYFCIITFNTQSSARKTLEGFQKWDEYTLEWVSDTGKFISDAHYAKQKIEEHRKNSPTFGCRVFDRDERGFLYALPIDRVFESGKALPYCRGIEKLIGKDLYNEIVAV